MTAMPLNSETAFYITGGTLPPDALSYVARDADDVLHQALLAGHTCYVLNSRQMGKSSLCVHTIQRLKADNLRTVFLDLTKFGSSNLSAEQWYAALLSETGRELGMRSEFLAYWKEHRELPPIQRVFGALTEIALPASPAPLIVFIDEIDITRTLPFSTDEFFAAIRQLVVGRANDLQLQKIAFCLLGTAAPQDLILDTRITPFNVGTRIELRDFTPAEATPLARGLNAQGNGANLLERVLYWTGGHPYLTQRLCRAAQESSTTSSADIDRLCHALFLSHTAKESDDNLANVRNRLLKNDADLAELLTIYGQVRAGRKVPDDDTNPLCAMIKLSGVVKVENGLLRVRNRIYATVFDLKWAATHLPDAEQRRQREAYRKGVARTSALAGAIIAVVGCLAAFAFTQSSVARWNAKVARDNAAKERIAHAESDHNLYIANMNLIQRDWDNANVEHILELLEATKTSEFRGWEWGYWNRMCHLELVTLKGHTGQVTSVMFSPDSTRVVTGSLDDTAKVWDARTGQIRLTFTGHKDWVGSACYSPDGRQIATGSNDKTAKIWDAQTGQEIITLRGHTNSVSSVAFSPNGKRIVTGSRDNTAKVWDVTTGRELFTLKGHTERVNSVDFASDGEHIVTGSWDKTAKVWNAQTGQEILTLKGHSKAVTCIAFSPDGKRIATGSADNTAKVWDALTGKELFTLKGGTSLVTCLAFSPDSKRIITGSGTLFLESGRDILKDKGDKTAKVWDAQTGRELLTLKGHREAVACAAFSADGRWIVTGSLDKTATVWDAVSGQERHTLKGHTDAVWSVCFSPDNTRIVTTSWDSLAKVWDVQTGQEMLTLKGHKGIVFSVGFSADGKRIVTGSEDRTVRTWISDLDAK